MHSLKILLNSYHSGANAWFALGEARGLFDAEGVSVRFTAGSGAFRACRRMMQDGFDLAFGDMSAMTGEAAERPGPMAVFTVHHRSPSAVAVVAGGPIHRPGDLQGRRVLTHLSDVAYRSFPAYAEAAGIDGSSLQVTLSDDPMAGMLQVMLDGGADAVFGYISSQIAVLRQIDPALADRLSFLPFPQVAPDLYGSVMMAAPQTLSGDGGAVAAFLRALTAALTQAVREPEAAVDAVLERNPSLDRDVEIERWRATIALELTHPETRQTGFGAPDMARLDRAAAALARTVPYPRAPRAAELFDAAFLPPLADRLALAQAIADSQRAPS